MSLIDIDINEEEKVFLLTGDTEEIKRNYRAKNYFLDILNANFHETGEIFIKFDEDNKDEILSKIHKILNKYNIASNDSSKIRLALDHYFQEEENFQAFTKQARDIWDNKVDVDQFDQFSKVIQEQLTNRVLYDKQLLASFHLAFSQNACNFSVPGSGKTAVVYAAYTFLKSLPKTNLRFVNKLLIIGPLSSFKPWEDEYFECFGVKPNSIRLSGGVEKEERDFHLLNIGEVESTPEIILMSYQTAANSIDNIIHYLSRIDHNVMVVLDEAHRIKNVEGGLWAESILKLSKYCSSRVVLTGTPMPNGYQDIFNLYQFIWPKRKLIRFNLFQLKNLTKNSLHSIDSRVELLIDDIKPFFIRIKKSDLDLPPANEFEPILIEMDEVQKEIYDLIENNYLGYFKRHEDELTFHAHLTRSRIIRLMQAASNPSLLKYPLDEYYNYQNLSNDLNIEDKELIEKIDSYANTNQYPRKYFVLLDLLKELLDNSKKVLIWATFIDNIKRLQSFLNENGINSKLLIGETPVETNIDLELIETREKIINEFHQDNSTFQVIIANPFAVSESISLHKACQNAIYLERTFNAANFVQSKDRIHRVGLEEEVNYFYLINKNTIEETIHERLKHKEERMIYIMEKYEIPLFSENLNYDVDLESDLKAIIKDYVGRTVKI